jgi:hypothetical protein
LPWIASSALACSPVGVMTPTAYGTTCIISPPCAGREGMNVALCTLFGLSRDVEEIFDPHLLDT